MTPSKHGNSTKPGAVRVHKGAVRLSMVRVTGLVESNFPGNHIYTCTEQADVSTGQPAKTLPALRAPPSRVFPSNHAGIIVSIYSWAKHGQAQFSPPRYPRNLHCVCAPHLTQEDGTLAIEITAVNKYRAHHSPGND